MKASWILLVFLFHDAASITYKYMENKCGDTIDVGSLNSVRLQLNEYWSQGTDSCQLSVKTSSESKIMFYFKSFSIGTSSDCYSNYNSHNDYGLEVRDGSSWSSSYVSGLNGKQCGTITSSKVYTTSGNHLYLWYYSDSSTSSDEFDMVITSYHTGNCRSSEHSCNNGRCISDSLTCNGYDPCGDSSDCNNVIVIGAIVGAAAGSTFLVVCLIVLVICCRRRRLTGVRPPINQPVSAITGSTVISYEQPPPQPYPQQYPVPQHFQMQQYPLHPGGQIPKN